MDNTESYAIWYSTVADYDKIMAQFVQDAKGSCSFEQDFDLVHKYMDYDHAVMIWYGQQHGELGKVIRILNPALDEGFSFIIDPVAELLEQQGVDQISYLFAMPEVCYEGQIHSNGMLEFLGNVKCEQETSEWMAELLRDL
ncbi:hypothetical protein HF638_11680 [Paenibacillus sp. SZ31]|uniref:hypothetical protein n=1 Tax=unclassified Paenibacillus TaxID=185978 RepID=UPI00146DCBFD|nr:hypothetical protein [Paenibacillus sp. SZ31]NMI04644.1 hypothetical protein [Paenibacillus sp. SZ31]